MAFIFPISGRQNKRVGRIGNANGVRTAPNDDHERQTPVLVLLYSAILLAVWERFYFFSKIGFSPCAVVYRWIRLWLVENRCDTLLRILQRRQCWKHSTRTIMFRRTMDIWLVLSARLGQIVWARMCRHARVFLKQTIHKRLFQLPKRILIKIYIL